MIEFLATLINTPLPSILVILGGVFLVLSNFRVKRENYTIEPENRGVPSIIGWLFIMVGISLFAIPWFVNESIGLANQTDEVSQYSSTSNQPYSTYFVSTEIIAQSTQSQLTKSGDMDCDGQSWANCWLIDDEARAITWIGFTNGVTDIAQDGAALQKLKAGYTAIVTLDVPMTINICVGTIDDTYVDGTCPKILSISAGRHQIVSPGSSGGFRIYP